MKKDNLKITAKSVKKVKPLAKGVILKSLNRNSNPSPQPSPIKGEGDFLSPLRERMRVRAFNFKRWHKLSAALASIAIIGIAVFFQFAPEKAQVKI